MDRLGAARLFVSRESYRFLGRLTSVLRWTTILAVLLLTVLQPSSGRAGLPTWAPILLLAVYSLLSDLVRLRMPTIRSLPAMAILDLPVAGLGYFLDAERGSIFFELCFMTLTTRATSLSSGASVTGSCRRASCRSSPASAMYQSIPRFTRPLTIAG